MDITPWQSCRGSMPGQFSTVIIELRTGKYQIAIYDDETYGFSWGLNSWHANEVAYWMYIPASPSGSKWINVT